MDQLSLGVMSRSRKENEHRLAIHPLHLERIEAELRGRIYLERGYAERFGVPDDRLAPHVAGLRTRDQLLADCDVSCSPSRCRRTCVSSARARFYGAGRTASRTRRSPSWPSTGG